MPGQHQLVIPDKNPNEFDLQTHYFDSRGRLQKTNHYDLHIVNGTKYFERPAKSGNLWYENNQPAGRIEIVNGVKEVKADAAHTVYTAPLSGDEALHFENETLKAKNAEMAREIEAIKAEREAKAQEQKPASPLAAAVKPQSPRITPVASPQAMKEN